MSMEMPIKVSAIVPIYNVENYIVKCLDSLIHQSYSDFEILLIDDGSTDNSGEIAESYANQYINVKYFKKINGGLSDARNFGIEHARGEYLMFIDSDDYVDVQLLEKLMGKQIQTQADIVACDMLYVYENGRQVVASAGNFDIGSAKDNLTLLKINNSACNKLFRRVLFDNIRFPIGKLYEDLFIVPILLFHANHIALVHEPLYFYLQREGSIVHKNNQRMFHIYEAINNVYIVLKDETKDKHELKRVIDSMYIEHGLHLTTLRIKQNGDFLDRKNFFKLNLEQLDYYHPTWYRDESISRFPIKSRFIFMLLKYRVFWFVALLLKRSSHESN